jgi:hypothetical protein
MADEAGIPADLRGQAVEIVVSQAKSELEDADTLTAALRHLVIPQTFATDLYNPDEDENDSVDDARNDNERDAEDVDTINEEFPFEPMVKLLIYREVKEISDGQLEDRLEKRPHLQRWFDVNRAPTQQTFWNTWNERFSPQTRHSIKVVARAITNVAIDEGVIRESLAVGTTPDEETEDDETTKREFIRRKTTKQSSSLRST